MIKWKRVLLERVSFLSLWQRSPELMSSGLEVFLSSDSQLLLRCFIVQIEIIKAGQAEAEAELRFHYSSCFLI